jgi:Ca2+/H+ antiporter
MQVPSPFLSQCDVRAPAHRVFLPQVLGVAVATIGLSASFAGMTIIAWMPSAMEIVNAMAFAFRNNIALAIEIGTSASVQ